MHSTLIMIVAFCTVGLTNPVGANPTETASSALQKRPKKARDMTLEAFISKLIKDGSDYSMSKAVAIDFGFSDALSTRADEFKDAETEDNMMHTAYVVVDKTSDSETSMDKWLLFTNKLKSNSKAVSLHFKLRTNGTLEKAYVTEYKYDENGKAIHGSAVTSDLDGKTAKVKAQLKHEMDFWLKGMYRKKKLGT